jgi:hypothetical protein
MEKDRKYNLPEFSDHNIKNISNFIELMEKYDHFIDNGEEMKKKIAEEFLGIGYENREIHNENGEPVMLVGKGFWNWWD